MNTNWIRNEELRSVKEEERGLLFSLCQFVEAAIRDRHTYELSLSANGVNHGPYVVEVSELRWAEYGDVPELSFSCWHLPLGGAVCISLTGWGLVASLLRDVTSLPLRGNFPRSGMITIHVESLLNGKVRGCSHVHMVDAFDDVVCSLRKSEGASR